MNQPVTPIRSGELRSIPLGNLKLDPLNPRLPESRRNAGQVELAITLELGFDAFAVAQSMVANGYFAAEPLIAVPSDDGEDAFFVVEGNRRLTALLGLAMPEFRSEFSEPTKWNTLAKGMPFSNETLIPVVVHEHRESTYAEISRAHVVGKLQWRPYMQARFIAARIDEGKSFQEVADLLGTTKSAAANLYRDQAIVLQAQDAGLNTNQIEKAFSLLTVAMGNTKLRDHVGAPLGSRLTPGEEPIPESKLGELEELVGWLFGSEEREPIIAESRQITTLGNVVASEVGLTELRHGKTLDEAKQRVSEAGLDPLIRLQKRLTAATHTLEGAAEDLAEFTQDPIVRERFDDIEAMVESMRNVLDAAELEADQ